VHEGVSEDVALIRFPLHHMDVPVPM